MKTETTKTQLVSQFADTISKVCETPEDLTRLIEGIKTMNEFFYNQKRNYERSTILDLLNIKSLVAEQCGEEQLRSMEDATDMFTAVLIQAETLEKEIDLIYDICNELV